MLVHNKRTPSRMRPEQKKKASTQMNAENEQKKRESHLQTPKSGKKIKELHWVEIEQKGTKKRLKERKEQKIGPRHDG